MIAIDVVGLSYFLKCEDSGRHLSQLYNRFPELVYRETICYLQEKGVERYLLKIVNRFRLAFVGPCPYVRGNCCCVVATNHESYYAICGCRPEDWVVAAKAGCQCNGQEFNQGVVCEVGETVGCLVVAKCDDLRRGCGVSGS